MTLSFGDAIKAGKNFDFGAYQEPAGFDIDFFSPDQTSGINWSDIYANPDVLKGYGDDYGSDLLGKSLKFVSDYAKGSGTDEQSQYFDAQKAASGLPTNKPSMSAYNIPGTNVTLTQAGMSTGGFLGGPLPAIAAGQGAFAGMNPGMQSLGFNDYAKMAASGLGNALKSKALYAINPVLGAVDQFYPGGIQQGFKDVTRFAGGIGNTVAKGVGGVVQGGIDLVKGLFCDERLKVDIAPLERTEVNDELAQMAFFVKGLRECS